MCMRAADMFAGFGGFAQGAERSRKARVIWAANHWSTAVEIHALNHPGAIHLCQDLNQANFYSVPDVDLGMAGPSCPGHSQAAQPARAKSPEIRGHHDKLRANAWAVIEFAEAKRPQFLLIENVTQFMKWKLYPVWDAALGILGYQREAHIIRASRMGVPQRRDRVFIIATLGKHPLGLTFEKEPEPGIGDYLDLEDDGATGWTRVADATPAVRGRIAKARKRGLGDVFLTQHVSGHPGVPLHEPIRTITTKDQWALVRGDVYRPLTVRENARAMGFDDSFILPDGLTRGDAIRGLGNAVAPPVAERIISAIARHA